MDNEFPIHDKRESHNLVGEEKLFFLYPSEFLAETPVIKDRLTRVKQTSLLTCIPHVCIGDREK